MLLRDHVLSTMEYLCCASPAIVGEVIGEDKFRVLKVMRRLEREGLIVVLREQACPCDRIAAYRLYFTTRRNYESARFVE